MKQQFAIWKLATVFICLFCMTFLVVDRSVFGVNYSLFNMFLVVNLVFTVSIFQNGLDVFNDFYNNEISFSQALLELFGIFFLAILFYVLLHFVSYKFFFNVCLVTFIYSVIVFFAWLFAKL